MSPAAWRMLGAALAAAAGVGYASYYMYRRHRKLQRYAALQTFYSGLKINDEILVGKRLVMKLAKCCRHHTYTSSHLQVVADFDMTLTRFKDEDGQRYDTCHGVIESSSRVPDSYRVETKKLKDHYFPLEYSPRLTNEEKSELMDEWWEKAHQQLIEAGVRQADIRDMVENGRIKFRDGVESFLATLSGNNIPLCIVSAGVSDVIMESMHHFFGHLPKNNLTVVSNQLQFNEDRLLVGVSEPTIHSYNKGQAVERQCNFQDSGRDNIVLVGDSLGDPAMVPSDDWLPRDFTVIRVGYLNDPKGELMRERYQDVYDIVILGDKDFTVVNDLIRCLTW